MASRIGFPAQAAGDALDELPIAGTFSSTLDRGAQWYYHWVPTFPRFLRDALRDCRSVLDLGCGKRSPLRFAEDLRWSLGVDLYRPYLLESRARRIHDQYARGDIRSLGLKPRAFDAVICLSVIEHLPKADGLSLLQRMGEWARRRVIVYTSNGFYHQEAYDGNPLQKHVSGWDQTELEELGFRVYGFGGWRGILKARPFISDLPDPTWSLLCNLSSILLARNPGASIDLCGIKEMS